MGGRAGIRTGDGEIFNVPLQDQSGTVGDVEVNLESLLEVVEDLVGCPGENF